MDTFISNLMIWSENVAGITIVALSLKIIFNLTDLIDFSDPICLENANINSFLENLFSNCCPFKALKGLTALAETYLTENQITFN